MSSETRHRGMHPADREMYGAQAVPALQQAVADLSWLFSRGYARASALKLVSDRHSLTERQLTAIGRRALPAISTGNKAAFTAANDPANVNLTVCQEACG